MIMYKRGMNISIELQKMEIKRRKNKKSDDTIWYDNIFCFDIETTSAYITPEGDIIVYDYTKPEEYYTGCEKLGIMYIWMFGIERGYGMEVYYGRTWEDLIAFFEDLNRIFPHNKTVWIHNASFEFQFLLNIFDFEAVFARKPHKVVTCDTGNLHFRCSYFLVNMSLAKWASQKRLPVSKRTGDLDYNVLRTPLTELTDQELGYCENDILVMYEGLKRYREKYKHIHNIPLTMTGEIRKVLEDITKDETNYKKRNVSMIPKTLSDYNFYMAAFAGGDVHANFIYADKLQHNVKSYDISSSYPWCMLSESFMCAAPVPVIYQRERFMKDPDFHYIVLFEAENIKCKLFNTWLSLSRTIDCRRYTLDNGRVMKAEYICACMYKWDYEMFKDYYEYSSLTILELRVAPVKPMNDAIRRFIVSLYKDKTRLKNVDEFYDEYMFIKQCINGIFGDQVQRAFDAETIFEGGTWSVKPVDDEYYKTLYNRKIKQSYKMYKSILTGLAIPSAARRNLWRGIIEPLDHQIVYFDTDSGKFIGPDNGVVSFYNMRVYLEHHRIARELGIDVNDLSPVDPDGVIRPIGVFSSETEDPNGYEEFKTLGAKKYAYSEKGKIHTTISGVPKRNAGKLKGVDELSTDLQFTPEECGRNIAHYLDDMPEVVFPDGFKSTAKHGICLQPTGYKMSISKDYFALLLANRSIYDRSYDIILQNLEGEDL